MINKTIIQGRCTANPELKQTQSGIYFTEFTVAWSKKYKENEKTLFLRCKAWRQTAEFICNYFGKGQEIGIEGEMITEKWEKDGQPQSRTICEIEKAHFCGGKSDKSEPKQSEQAEQTDTDFVEVAADDDDLPF